jgi:hypothetical protein
MKKLSLKLLINAISHIFLSPVAPNDGDGLEERNEHEGDGCCVVVHQLEEVDTALKVSPVNGSPGL